MSVADDMTISMIDGWYHDASDLSGCSPGCSPGFTPVGLPLTKGWSDPKLAEAVQDMMARQATASSDCQTQLWDATGSRCFRYRLTPLLKDGSLAAEGITPVVKGVSVIATDITDMVEAEEQLRRAEVEHARLVACEAAVQEASRLKTEYFTHISHEIRTPVAAIISIAELLLADPQLDAEQRLLVSQALKSGQILLELVSTVLELRKIESGELKLECKAFRTADLIEDAQLLSVLVTKKVAPDYACLYELSSF